MTGYFFLMSLDKTLKRRKSKQTQVEHMLSLPIPLYSQRPSAESLPASRETQQNPWMLLRS